MLQRTFPANALTTMLVASTTYSDPAPDVNDAIRQQTEELRRLRGD
jgi:hypothetical protein